MKNVLRTNYVIVKIKNATFDILTYPRFVYIVKPKVKELEYTSIKYIHILLIYPRLVDCIWFVCKYLFWKIKVFDFCTAFLLKLLTVFTPANARPRFQRQNDWDIEIRNFNWRKTIENISMKKLRKRGPSLRSSYKRNKKNALNHEDK